MQKFISDCKHMSWLFKQMFVLGFKGDWDGANEAWFFIKLHWLYQSKRTSK